MSNEMRPSGGDLTEQRELGLFGVAIVPVNQGDSAPFAAFVVCHRDFDRRAHVHVLPAGLHSSEARAHQAAAGLVARLCEAIRDNDASDVLDVDGSVVTSAMDVAYRETMAKVDELHAARPDELTVAWDREQTLPRLTEFARLLAEQVGDDSHAGEEVLAFRNRLALLPSLTPMSLFGDIERLLDEASAPEDTEEPSAVRFALDGLRIALANHMHRDTYPQDDPRYSDLETRCIQLVFEHRRRGVSLRGEEIGRRAILLMAFCGFDLDAEDVIFTSAPLIDGDPVLARDVLRYLQERLWGSNYYRRLKLMGTIMRCVRSIRAWVDSPELIEAEIDAYELAAAVFQVQGRPEVADMYVQRARERYALFEELISERSPLEREAWSSSATAICSAVQRIAELYASRGDWDAAHELMQELGFSVTGHSAGFDAGSFVLLAHRFAGTR